MHADRRAWAKDVSNRRDISGGEVRLVTAYALGKTLREIAADFDITVNATKLRLSRLKRRLRPSIGDTDATTAITT
jgi:hypothetical protein